MFQNIGNTKTKILPLTITNNQCNIKQLPGFEEKYKKYNINNFIISISAASASSSKGDKYEVYCGNEAPAYPSYTGYRRQTISGGTTSATSLDMSYQDGILTINPGSLTTSGYTAYTTFTATSSGAYNRNPSVVIPTHSASITYTYKVFLIDAPSDKIEIKTL